VLGLGEEKLLNHPARRRVAAPEAQIQEQRKETARRWSKSALPDVYRDASQSLDRYVCSHAIVPPSALGSYGVRVHGGVTPSSYHLVTARGHAPGPGAAATAWRQVSLGLPGIESLVQHRVILSLEDHNGRPGAGNGPKSRHALASA
jgi:hypothetical protein